MTGIQPHHGKSQFFEYKDVQTPPPEDAEIFERAAMKLDTMRPVAAILASGGTRQHVNHFSMMVCANKPVDPWADQQEPDVIKTELFGVADKLKGSVDEG